MKMNRLSGVNKSSMFLRGRACRRFCRYSMSSWSAVRFIEGVVSRIFYRAADESSRRTSASSARGRSSWGQAVMAITGPRMYNEGRGRRHAPSHGWEAKETTGPSLTSFRARRNDASHDRNKRFRENSAQPQQHQEP